MESMACPPASSPSVKSGTAIMESMACLPASSPSVKSGTAIMESMACLQHRGKGSHQCLSRWPPELLHDLSPWHLALRQSLWTQLPVHPSRCSPHCHSDQQHLGRLSLGSSASWKTSSVCCALSTSRACFCSLPFSRSSSKWAIANAIPQPSGLGLGLSSGCFAMLASLLCKLFQAELLPGHGSFHPLFWAEWLSGHFLPSHTPDSWRGKQKNDSWHGMAPVRFPQFRFKFWAVSSSQKKATKRFLSEASNIDPAIIIHHPTPFPSRFPVSSEKMPCFFRQSPRNPWDCGSGAGQTWHHAASTSFRMEMVAKEWLTFQMDTFQEKQKWKLKTMSWFPSRRKPWVRIHGGNYLQKITNLLRICPQTSWNTNYPWLCILSPTPAAWASSSAYQGLAKWNMKEVIPEWCQQIQIDSIAVTFEQIHPICLEKKEAPHQGFTNKSG